MCAGTVFAPLNLEGDMWLGGDNFDEVIVQHTMRHIQADYGIDPSKNHRFMVQLKSAAQTVKERLSAADGADLLVTGLLQDGSGNLIDIDLHITRGEVERLLLPLLDEYLECPSGHPNFVTDSLCAFCRSSLQGVTPKDGRALALTKKALKHPSVNLRPDQVDHVVMAGNSTNIPLVQRTMERLFGAERIVRKIHPKHAVALGAAIVANWMGQRVVCQAVDRTDPQRECGHVNDDDAQQCAKCGTPLVVEPSYPTGGAPGQVIGRVGGIAPISYGTGAHQDVYRIFIRKNDPYPTQDPQAQTFYTTLPRQRMISIPIYGGEASRASANEKQGEAFAILPVGLPAATPVRVKLWLNADGVLQVGAQMADGTNLRPWLVKGEKDARAIAAIEGVNAALEGGAMTDAHVIQQVEDARNRAFDRLRAEQFDEALQEAEAAGALVANAQPHDVPGTPEAVARDLLQWAVFVIDRYAFAFDRTMQLRLEGLIAELSSALESRDGARIGRAYDELDVATQTPPAIVNKFLQLRVAIARRVKLGAPGVATTLVSRIEQVEELFRKESPDGPHAFESLSNEIVAAIEQVARAVGIECSRKHAVPKGQRYCPECREDTWSLAAGA
jgi:molecular chaperone DnaK (HSP70)